jgi:coenzyme F420-reducing hydrogenase delta subunit
MKQMDKKTVVEKEKKEISGNIDKGSFEPKIVAFLCNWCSYAGADLAGVSRIQYSPNIRIIRVPCSGRINPLYILKALQNGVDGVLVSGCHPGDCHYISGNYYARRKFALMKSYLEYIGIEPERVQFSWVSASEGGRFAQLVEKVINEVRILGPNNNLFAKNGNF